MTWPMGLARSPLRTRSRYSASAWTMPPPEPPSVNAGRMIAGRPISASAARALLAFGGRRAFDHDRRWIGLADFVQQPAEALAILGHLDRLERRAQQACLVPFENALAGELDAQVERRLAAQAGQDAVRMFALEDALDRRDGEWLEVDDVRHARVGHDRGRVAVEQDRPDAFRAERAAGLRAGVVELRRLADDHRPTADDQHRPRLHAFAHSRAMKRSKTSSASSGPGDPSGWYWTVSIGLVR